VSGTAKLRASQLGGPFHRVFGVAEPRLKVLRRVELLVEFVLFKYRPD